MVSSKADAYAVGPEAANGLAGQFEARAQEGGIAEREIEPRAAKVFRWTTWPEASPSEIGSVIAIDDVPALVLRFESDRFNTSCLGIRQGRMHWLLNPAVSWNPERASSLSKQIAAILRESDWEMVAVRLLGHNPPASDILQRAGFRMIVGNAWFYRWPEMPAPAWTLTKNIELELRDIRRHPLTSCELSEGLAVARESVFPDRFSMDPRVAPELAKSRFMKIVENSLLGQIADYAALATIDSEIQTLVLFGVTESSSPGGSPIAGERLTALARNGPQVSGLSYALIAESIRSLPEGNANWTVASMLGNFRSLGGITKLRFRYGAIAYDFHWWREGA